MLGKWSDRSSSLEEVVACFSMFLNEKPRLEISEFREIREIREIREFILRLS